MALIEDFTHIGVGEVALYVSAPLRGFMALIVDNIDLDQVSGSGYMFQPPYGDSWL